MIKIEWCFRPRFCTFKTILGREQRGIFVMNHVPGAGSIVHTHDDLFVFICTLRLRLNRWYRDLLGTSVIVGDIRWTAPVSPYIYIDKEGHATGAQGGDVLCS